MNLNSAKRIAEKIRAEKNRPNWPTPVKFIGGGADGRVYLTNSGKLMKITFDADPQEFRGLAKLQNTGLVPTFNKRNWVIMGKTKRGTKITAFLMGKVGGPDDRVMTLHEYTKSALFNPRWDWRAAVSRAIRKMHAKGVSHGNLHEQNILVVVSPDGKIKLYIIDFGRSTSIPVGRTERERYGGFKLVGTHPTGPFRMNVPLFANEKRIPRRANVHMAKVLYNPINRNAEARIRGARRIVNTKEKMKSVRAKAYENMGGNIILEYSPTRLPLVINKQRMKLVTSNLTPKTLAKLRKITNVLPKWKRVN